MEYTKDVIINVKYNKKSSSVSTKSHKLTNWIQKDNYFTLTMIISILVLSLDYLIIKKFIELISLL